jgi:hypothetical protein
MMEDDTPLVHKFEPFKPQPIDSTPFKKQRKKPLLAVWKFIKKHKTIFSIVVSVIVILTAIVMTILITIPVIPLGSYKLVSNDATVRLEPGQTAMLKYSNVTMSINRFISNVCPVAKCFGSGPVVDYTFKIDGQKYVDTSMTPTVPVYRYQIKTVNTDYKSYAEIKIVKS